MERTDDLRVAGIGEILWDLLPGGKRLGGAPANFAGHAQALGAAGAIISAVGADDLGEEARLILREMGLRDDLITTVDRPTGTVSVVLDEAGHPTFTIHEDVAWDELPLLPEATAFVAEADAICFGSLAQRGANTRRTIRALLDAAPAGAVRVFDVNLRAPFYGPQVLAESLEMTDILKLNDEELPIVGQLLEIDGDEATRLRELVGRYDLRLVALTRGSRGSLLFNGQETAEHPGCETTVRDTIGAGDAFTATLAVGWCRGLALADINAAANRVAAFVCSQVGALPSLPDHLQRLLEEDHSGDAV
jgi:fructokinase